ncbi:hypothetical protein F0U44_07000 [Nocardioides humilatus]|uniref:Uncharacterized protein n=1 Tax=Nocardioides humilatus TaxID=2607660 RepID=A0A5B1LHH1_9ACTN|nr:hypothetical protein [Nocardioides humilatus]KAA1420171.1 hypothetical protein F0U44_07000 [Nocardioides humilatus]
MGLRKKKTLLEQGQDYVEAAIDQAKEFVQGTALPALNDARDKAAPVVAAGATTIAEKAGEAKAFADAKTAQASGKKQQKGSKLKKLFLLGALGGAAAVVAKKLQGGESGGGWQSAYEPAPPPAAPVAEAVPDLTEADPLADPLADPRA